MAYRGVGNFRNGTTHLLSDLSLKTRVGSRTSVPFGQNVRKNLACGPSLENVMFLHTQDAFFLANPLFLPSIAFDLPLPNFWITISAISITIDRGLIS